MKKGLLIVNEFLRASKYSEIYDWLSAAAVKSDIVLSVKSNAEYLVLADEEKLYPEVSGYDFVLFWDKDIPLARAFEKAGLPVFNSSNAIAVCDNKGLTFEALAGKVRMPKTIRIPMTFSAIGYTSDNFMDMVEDILGFPYVLKECYGSFGAQVYLINSREEALERLKSANGRECIAQEYIVSSKGRDVRIHTVGDKVITSMIRYNDNDFRANITNGGSMLPYTPDEAHEKMALEVAELLKLDFAGIDLLFDENDEPILCEVNSNAHFRNIFDCTGVNVAEAIMEYIAEKIG